MIRFIKAMLRKLAPVPAAVPPAESSEEKPALAEPGAQTEPSAMPSRHATTGHAIKAQHPMPSRTNF
jgi:hypothetical protein